MVRATSFLIGAKGSEGRNFTHQCRSPGVRKTLVDQYPWLLTSRYKAFCEKKALAMADLVDVNALMVTLPWLEAEARETMAIMGEDFWKYRVQESLRDIEALVGYSFEQGLIDRKVSVGELFHPSVFEMSKVWGRDPSARNCIRKVCGTKPSSPKY